MPTTNELESPDYQKYIRHPYNYPHELDLEIQKWVETGSRNPTHLNQIIENVHNLKFIRLTNALYDINVKTLYLLFNQQFQAYQNIIEHRLQLCEKSIAKWHSDMTENSYNLLINKAPYKAFNHCLNSQSNNLLIKQFQAYKFNPQFISENMLNRFWAAMMNDNLNQSLSDHELGELMNCWMYLNMYIGTISRFQTVNLIWWNNQVSETSQNLINSLYMQQYNMPYSR